MYPYALIDLHCDTLTMLNPEDVAWLASPQDPACRGEVTAQLTERVRETNTLDLPGRHFALSAIPEGVHWCQCCAVFIPDGLSREEAMTYYDLHQRNFWRQMDELEGKVLPCRTAADLENTWAQGKAAAILTVENGSALAGQLDRVESLAQDGVRMVTLTWNGENELGSGNVTDHGLSPFGKRVVRALEEQSILVDVSHLNDRSLADLLETATKPFVASHSNARAVCGHRRNLTDGQIQEMAARRCLIGLNFCQDFLRAGSRPATMDDLYRHVEHFLELGAEDCLALGSDADGADIPAELNSPAKFAGLYQYVLGRGLSPELADKIFWKNALKFFQQQLI